MKRLGLALMLAGLLATVAAPAALGCTFRIPVSDTLTTVSVVSPGVTTQNGSVLSVRGLVQNEADASTSPFVAGTSRGTVNFDVDLATGTGKIWGTEIKQPTAFPHGHWDCRFSGTFVNGTWTAKGSCDGRGTLWGWRFKADLAQQPTSVAVKGYIFRSWFW